MVGLLVGHPVPWHPLHLSAALQPVTQERRRFSCLQIRRHDVMLVDDARLQDGLHQAWPADAVAEHVAVAVQRLRPTEASGAWCHAHH